MIGKPSNISLVSVIGYLGVLSGSLLTLYSLWSYNGKTRLITSLGILVLGYWMLEFQGWLTRTARKPSPPQETRESTGPGEK